MKQVITVCLVMCVLAVRASPWPNRDTPIGHRSELPIEKQIEQFPEYPPVFPKAEDFPSGSPDGNHQESISQVGGTPLEQPKVDGKRLVADSVLETMFKVRELCGDVSTGCWENSIFSPLSINSISALLWTGSSGNTESELRSFLGYPEDVPVVEEAYNELVGDISRRFRTDQNMQVKVANRLFLFNTTLDAQFEEKFKRNDYGSVAKFSRVHADAIKEINEWVASQTNNKINKVVDDRLHPKSQLVGVNTVYFKGQWLESFDTEFTGDFKVTQEETIRVSMMTGDTGVGYVENADLGCKMIAIPYKDPNLAMHLVLPTEPHGLKQLEAKLNSEVLKKLIDSMDVKSVLIKLPKFRISKKQSLKTRLLELGVRELFTPNGADLSRMIRGGGVALNEMIHEAFIEVSEDGTEAAAATIVFDTRGGTRRYKGKFIADQPFLFFIRDKSTGIVYFYGRVVRPEE